jgi:ubiquinone/menaquinone biosynthesis C-methylase UbiE
MIRNAKLHLALLMILCTAGVPDSLLSEQYDTGRSQNHHESSEHDEHHHHSPNNPKRIEANRRYDKAWRKWQEQLFGIKIEEGMVVADIGAGEGDLVMHVAKRVGPDGFVYANEIDLEKLYTIGRKATDRGLNNIAPILGRDDDPLFPPGQVDIAVMVEVYHHLNDKMAFLERIRSRLKPGGQLVIVEADVNQDGGEPDGCYSDPVKTRQELEESGFRNRSLQTKKIEDLILFVLTATCPE